MTCVTCVDEKRNIHRILVGKPEGKNDLEDPGVDILKWILDKTGRQGVYWINLA